MSKFTKKAKKEGPRIYRVRDIFEIFKNGKATIRIIKRQCPKGYEAWAISVFWEYSEGAYNLYAFPVEILNRVVFDVEIANNGNTIYVYI